MYHLLLFLKTKISIGIILLFSFNIWNNTTNAQSHTFQGQLVDTIMELSMNQTSIALLDATDSILIESSRADDEGKFSINYPKEGNYIILIAHPDFVPLITTLQLPAQNHMEFQMMHLDALLDEVIVTDNRAIIIKGDTTEYNADSFKVGEHADVSELLKRIPGIEIDEMGRIKAQGKAVQKMLVDGDEFFSDDPAQVSKLLKASAIAKIQIYDGKTEEAKFSGVDDGEKIKTINLQLKAHAKNGHMGKLDVAGGLPEFYQNQVMLNRFKNKKRFSIYAMMSNTNKIGLERDDVNKFSSSYSEFSNDESGDFTYFQGFDDRDGLGENNGSYRGQGVPKTQNGGLHFSDKFGKEQLNSFSTDYRYNQSELLTITNTNTHYILPDTQYFYQNNTTSQSQFLSHKLAGKINIKSDSTIDFTVTLLGGLTQNKNTSNSENRYINVDNKDINNSTINNQSETEIRNFNAFINFRKRLKKAGRSYSIGFTNIYRDSKGNNDFYSNNYFNTTGTSLIYNQLKATNNEYLKFRFTSSYYEPISKNWVYVASAYVNKENNSSQLLTYDKTPTIDTLNERYSNDYNFNVLTSSAGSFIRYNKDKIYLSLGGHVVNTDVNQMNNFTNKNHHFNMVNFFPNANFSLYNGMKYSLNFSYKGNTRQPSINQLLPVENNNNPLNRVIGNPDLTQSFNNSVSGNFSINNVLKSSGWRFYGYFQAIQNDFGNEQTISNEGVSTYRTININGNKYLYADIERYFKIPILNARVTTQAGINYNKNNNILNGSLIESNRYGLSFSVSSYIYKDSTFDFNQRAQYNYSFNMGNMHNDIKTDFSTFTHTLNAGYNFHPLKMRFDVNYQWNVREKMDVQDLNNNVFLLNASISKTFLADKSLMVKLSGFDILNQNIGFDRYNNISYVTESRYNNIRRFFTLGISWNFSKTYGKEETSTDNNGTDPLDFIN